MTSEDAAEYIILVSFSCSFGTGSVLIVHLVVLAVLEPLHLLLGSHSLPSVHVSNLEVSIVTATLVATLCIRVELTLMVHKSDGSND